VQSTSQEAISSCGYELSVSRWREFLLPSGYL